MRLTMDESWFRKQATAILKDIYGVLFVTRKSAALNSLEQTNLKIMLCIDLVFPQSWGLDICVNKGYCEREIDMRTGKIRMYVCYGLITGALYKSFSDFTFKKLTGGRCG